MSLTAIMIDSDDSKFWVRGIPLNEAWLKLLDADAPEYQYWARYETLWHRPLEGEYDAKVGGLREAYEPKAISERHRARFNLEDGLKVDFHAWLESGEVAAFGKQISPQISTEPTRIPSGLFGEFRDASGIDWDRDRVRFGAMVFEDVRVLRARELALSEPLGKRGRPRKKDDLERAAKMAAEQFSDFCALPRKQACDHVRDILKNTLKLSNADEIAKSDKTISKAIFAVCKAISAQNENPDL